MADLNNEDSPALDRPPLRKRANSDPFRDWTGRPFRGDNWRQFVYRHLDPKSRQIRLLVLFPSCDFESDPEGDLVIADIAAFRYEAVSYVWGDHSDQGRILLNGFRVPIGTTAHTALRSLRHIKEYRLLWLDALCINQRDLHERNYQVTLMRDIFSAAWAVVYWLGEPVKANADFLRRLEQIAATLRQNALSEARIIYPEPMWAILRDFFQQSFWRRLWIVPELQLGSDKPHSVFRAGTVDMSCYGFWQTMMRLSYHQKTVIDFGFSSLSLSLNYLAFDGVPFIKSLQNFSQEALFLALNVDTDTTDPRDRVYVLSGLTTPKLIIEPHYEKTVESVYQDAAYAIFADQHSLELLLASGIDPDLPHALPSWTPDWRQGNEIHGHYQRWLQQKGCYNSNGGQPAVVTRRENLLKVPALKVVDAFSFRLLGPSVSNVISDVPGNFLPSHFKELFNLWQYCKNRWSCGSFPSYVSFSLLEKDLTRTLYLDKEIVFSHQENFYPVEAFLEKVFHLAATEATAEAACTSFIAWLREEHIVIEVAMTIKHRLRDTRIAISPSGQLCILPAWAEEVTACISSPGAPYQSHFVRSTPPKVRLTMSWAELTFTE